MLIEVEDENDNAPTFGRSSVDIGIPGIRVYGYTVVGYSRVEGFWNFKNGHSASCAKLF